MNSSNLNPNEVVLMRICKYANSLPRNDPFKAVIRGPLDVLTHTDPADSFAFLNLLNKLGNITVTVKTFTLFSNSSKKVLFKDYLRDQGKIAGADPLDHHHASEGSLEFNKDNLAILTNIYDLTAKLAKLEWVHNYVKDTSSDQILNQAIGEWQGVMMAPENPDEAQTSMQDFKRNFRIDGVKADEQTITDEEVTARLQALVDKTSYSANEKILMMEWLMSGRGAQLNNLLAAKLFYNKEFSTSPIEMGRTKGSHYDWGVQNGRLCLNLAVEYTTLVDSGSFTHLGKTKEGVDISAKSPDEIGALQELRKNNQLMPLATVKASIELDTTNLANKLQVVPKVTALQVCSFTNKLHEPKPAYFFSIGRPK